MKNIRFLHFADLHYGIKKLNEDRALFERIEREKEEFLYSLKDIVKGRDLDFLLISGDLFDRPILEERYAELVADALGQIEKPVYIIPGNHDPLIPNSIWDRFWPKNIHIFDEIKSFILEEFNLQIDGAPYKSFYSDEILYDIEDFKNLKERKILLHHGDITNSKSKYNPISPESTFFEKYDYIAFGHIHKKDVNYPGFIKGISFSDTGKGSFRIVNMENTIEIEEIEIQGLYFKKIYIDEKFLDQNIEVNINKYIDSDPSDIILELIITGRYDKKPNLSIIKERLKNLGFYRINIIDKSKPAIYIDELKKEKGFLSLIAKSVEEIDDEDLKLRVLDLIFEAMEGKIEYEN